MTCDFPNWRIIRLHLNVQSTSNVFKDKSTCALGLTIFPCSPKFSLVLLEFVKSKTRSVSFGCLHTSSAYSLTITSNCVHLSKLLWVILSINPWWIVSLKAIFMKRKNASLTPVSAARKPRCTALASVTSIPCIIAPFRAKLLRFLSSVATSDCSSTRDENKLQNSVVPCLTSSY